jgi:hypothetical protein
LTNFQKHLLNISNAKNKHYFIKSIKNTDICEWSKIGEQLTSYFGICSCQRKLKTIINNLVSIKEKCLKRDYSFTGAEWLIIALIEKDSWAIKHGINCEYPIINEDDPFWVWIDEVKDNPNLEDN